VKAIVYEKYGSPDVLQLKEVEKPTPADNEVLVKIHAAAANAADWHLVRGTPVVMRLSMGFPTPKDTRLGLDFAGEVEAVGSQVTQFQPGDAVFGEAGAGAFAEYVCVSPDRIVHKPDNISMEAAAAVPVSALTALQGLRDTGQIQAGQQVLINGASGGVGTFAVQIAKAYGAEVTGVCSTGKIDQTRAIGADHVIDYTQEDFTRSGQQYDLIYDVAANHSMAAYARVLKPQGRYQYPRQLSRSQIVIRWSDGTEAG
jgi:NADPH:quinone reductase-like Zn-dependent oxidoreductase